MSHEEDGKKDLDAIYYSPIQIPEPAQGPLEVSEAIKDKNSVVKERMGTRQITQVEGENFFNNTGGSRIILINAPDIYALLLSKAIIDNKKFRGLDKYFEILQASMVFSYVMSLFVIPFERCKAWARENVLPTDLLDENKNRDAQRFCEEVAMKEFGLYLGEHEFKEKYPDVSVIEWQKDVKFGIMFRNALAHGQFLLEPSDGSILLFNTRTFTSTEQNWKIRVSFADIQRIVKDATDFIITRLV